MNNQCNYTQYNFKLYFYLHADPAWELLSTVHFPPIVGGEEHDTAAALAVVGDILLRYLCAKVCLLNHR